MITADDQLEFFRNYYSYDVIQFLNKLKEKYNHLNLLNNTSTETTNDFVELLAENIDLKKMYLQHLKS
tara:strand:- start:147 stop:350 length:204 start_codon:yes stop_codon:yes gene_type:complete